MAHLATGQYDLTRTSEIGRTKPEVVSQCEDDALRVERRRSTKEQPAHLHACDAMTARQVSRGTPFAECRAASGTLCANAPATTS